MTLINYTQGDATTPIGSGNKIIVHICNDIGGWGKGFVLAISKKWKQPEAHYRAWYQSNTRFDLGQVQLVQVEEQLWVANLIGQHKIKKRKNGKPPIRYEAIKEGLKTIAKHAKNREASVHMPRIGCGLAGGKWEYVEPLIKETLSEMGIITTVYDFS